MVFLCSSLTTGDAECLCLSVTAHLLRGMSVRALRSFVNWAVCFLLLSCRNSWYIWVLVAYLIHELQMFSPLCGLSFHFWIASLDIGQFSFG